MLNKTPFAAAPICPICGRPADKTNAHLIPWFIIKSIVTQQGSGIRDKELSFTISSGHFTKMFAGRSVLPETIEEFGDLHELEKELQNPYSRDHLWCSKCEEKFSRLEAIFATQLNETKIRNLANLPQHDAQKLVIDKGFHPSLYELFIQTIFWRCSVGRFDGFVLGPDIEAKILNNLREAFKIDNFHKAKANDIIPLIHSFPLVTTLLYAASGEDPTQNYVLINKSSSPYFIMAGKWLFQLFEKERSILSTQEWLYGIRTITSTVEMYARVKEQSHVILLDEAASKVFSRNRLDYFVEKKRRGVLADIRMVHHKIFGFKPNEDIQHYIYHQYLKHHDNGKTEFESFVHAFYDLRNL